MQSTSNNYWTLIWQRFQRHRGAKWSFRAFILLLWIAILNPFVAGDVPIYAQIDGKSSFPIFQQYLIDLGLKSKTGNFLDGSYWHEVEYEQVILPIIPYSASYRDVKNIHFKSPFDQQRMDEGQSWHWLGTDKLGRDVAAAIIQGVRVALKVGLFSMLIATILGLFLGGLAGYFGDDRLQLPISTLILNGIGLFFAIHFAFISRSYALSLDDGSYEGFKSAGIFIAVMLVANLVATLLTKLPFLRKTMTVPVDLFIMRLIEVLSSIPGLLLIIAFAAIFSTKTIWPIILIIGFLKWTSVARFFRSELLKVRNLSFMQAAQVLGFSDWRMLFKHALPNAIGPVIIIVAFGIAQAILVEASLSFLGIGVQEGTQITWGTLLRERSGAENWWMAVFPGLAIFVTILIFNLIGEGLKDAIDAK
ncbi:MAG: ABC transporter permease [Bacteroidota bacterium]